MGRKKQLPGTRYGFRLLMVVKHFPAINLALISGEGLCQGRAMEGLPDNNKNNNTNIY